MTKIGEEIRKKADKGWEALVKTIQGKGLPPGLHHIYLKGDFHSEYFPYKAISVCLTSNNLCGEAALYFTLSDGKDKLSGKIKTNGFVSNPDGEYLECKEIHVLRCNIYASLQAIIEKVLPSLIKVKKTDKVVKIENKRQAL